MPDSAHYSYNGNVTTFAAYGNTLYVGGDFTRMGRYTGSFIGADDVTGVPINLQAWPKVNGRVLACIPDGSGGWIIGGGFTSVGGVGRGNLAQINASGQLTSWNPSANDTVYTILSYNNTIYVGGRFTTVGGQTRNKIAAVSITTGAATTWNPNGGIGTSNVRQLYLDGTTLYVGGQFTQMGGTRTNLAAFDITTGLLTPWAPTANIQVNAFAVNAGIVYVGGYFTQINGFNRAGIAAIDAITGTLTTWNPGSGNAVMSLVINGANILVGGNFTFIGGQLRKGFAELSLGSGNATGTIFDLNSTGTLQTMCKIGNTVYLGGDFTTINTTIEKDNIAAVDVSSNTVLSWESHADNAVYTIQKSGTTIFAGGAFKMLGRKIRNYVASINLLDDEVTQWNPNPSSVVVAVFPTMDTVYLGGSYLDAVSSSTGTLLTGFDVNIAGGTIKALHKHNNTLYLGGSFTHVGGIQRKSLASVNASTGAVTTWNPLVTGTVTINDFVAYNSTLYVGGVFTHILGQSRDHLAAIDLNTATLAAWDPNPNAGIYKLAADGGLIYVSGVFTSIGGQSRNYVAAVDATTGLANSWNPAPDDDIEHMQAAAGTIYVAGSFNTIGINTVNRDYLASVKANGVATTFLPPPLFGTPIKGMFVYNNKWYLGSNTNFDIVGPNTKAMAIYDILDAPPIVTISGNNTVCAGTATTYSASTSVTGATYQWQVNGSNVGGNTTTYTYTPANNDQVKCIITVPLGACNTTTTDTSNIITVTITPSTTPTISVAGASTVCTGSSSAYTATTNITGGTYQWQVNNVNVGTNSGTYSYTPANNDQVKCIITVPSTGCFSTTNATSNIITVTIVTSITPTISITTPNTTVCSGTSVTYTATTNVTGGTYQWQVNNVNVGTNSATYTHTPANGNQVKCIVTVPVGGCYTATTVTSNIITMTVTPSITPTISIAATSTNVCSGTSVTYTATTNITGGTYQWQVNNVNAGTNSNTYSYTPSNGDQVKCIITVPGTGCFTANSATSNVIAMTVGTAVAPTISISGNTDICGSVNTTYTAITNVTGGNYQWQVNGVNAGGNAATYSYTPANGDVVTCVVTVVTGCFTANNATSNSLSITVTSQTTPTISISAPTAESVGNTVNVTATVNNAGTNYNIEWKNNGTTFDNTSVPATSYVKGPGQDNITAIITPVGCYTVVTSNTATVDELLSVGETGAKNTIEVFPNPFSSEITITDLQQNDIVMLVDVMGKKVGEWKISLTAEQTRLSVTDLSSGIYMLRVCDKDGNTRMNVMLNRK